METVNGPMVRAARLRAKMTQEELGRKLHCGRQKVILIEGKAEVSVADVEALDKVFGTDKWRKGHNAVGVEAQLEKIVQQLEQAFARIERLETQRGVPAQGHQQPFGKRH